MTWRSTNFTCIDIKRYVEECYVASNSKIEKKIEKIGNARKKKLCSAEDY